MFEVNEFVSLNVENIWLNKYMKFTIITCDLKRKFYFIWFLLTVYCQIRNR